MKNRYLLVPAIGLVATSPAMAQSSPISGAVKGTMTQTPITPPPPPPLYIPPPAPPAPPPRMQVRDYPDAAPVPPPMRLAPAPPPPRYPRDPVLVNYRDALPKQADYPLSSWQNDEEGTVRYALDVDVDGNATDCTITESSGSETLDAKTCEVVMERSEFRPAMEDADTPIAGTVARSYTWRKREPDLPPLSITFQYLHDETGKTSDCKILKMEGDLPEPLRRNFERDLERNNGCPNPPSQRGIPYRDENGVPIAKQVTVTFDVKVDDAVE